MPDLTASEKFNGITAIDLGPHNFATIAGLLIRRKGELKKTGMTGGFALMQAYHEVAGLLKPETSAQELAKWYGQYLADRKREKKAGAKAVIKAANGHGSVAHVSASSTGYGLDPDILETEDDASFGITPVLLKSLEGLAVGKMALLSFRTKERAEAAYKNLSNVTKKLGWRANKYEKGLKADLIPAFFEGEPTFSLKVVRLL